jgi:TrwC relaxase
MVDVEASMQARVRKGNEVYDRTTGNMVYATFVHRETRPIKGMPDPHTHHHVYVLNATFDPIEQEWKAGKFRKIKEDSPFFQAAFNARLASKLVAGGYSIRRTETHFELASVSRELINKFSKRTKEIDEKAQREGITSATEKAKLGLRSREKKLKTPLPPAAQLAWWRTQMSPAERESLQPSNVRGASSDLMDSDAAKALTVEHLFANQSVSRPLHVAAEYLRRGIGRVTVADAMEFLKDPRLILRHEKVTTAQALAEEREMINTVAKGHFSLDKRRPIGGWSLPLPDHLSSEQVIA